MIEQKCREHHEPHAPEEAPLPFSVVSLDPMPEAVTVTEQIKVDRRLGVLGRLPAATD